MSKPFITPEMLQNAVMTAEEEKSVLNGVCPKCQYQGLVSLRAGSGLSYTGCPCGHLFAVGSSIPTPP